MEAFGKSDAIYQALANAHPSEVDYQTAQVYNSNSIGPVFAMMGKPAEALRSAPQIAGDCSEGDRCEPRRHHDPEVRGRGLQHHRCRPVADGQSVGRDRGDRGSVEGSGDPPAAGRLLPGRHRVPE